MVPSEVPADYCRVVRYLGIFRDPTDNTTLREFAQVAQQWWEALPLPAQSNIEAVASEERGSRGREDCLRGLSRALSTMRLSSIHI